MLRMIWTGNSTPVCSKATVRLGASDVSALKSLYADGQPSGESPDFFYPSMVTDGVFHGIYQAQRSSRLPERTLLRARRSGEHRQRLHSPRAARARVRTRRHAGGAQRPRRIETVGLNVRADNGAAVHLYESLGFARHCEFYERYEAGS